MIKSLEIKNMGSLKDIPADSSLEVQLVRGIESGDPVILDEAEWKRIRSEVEQRLKSDNSHCQTGQCFGSRVFRNSRETL
jgi:hypothetical protein